MLNLKEKEKNTLFDFIEKNLDKSKNGRFMIEVNQQAMSTNVTVSVINENEHVFDSRKTSIIDWENYNF